MKSLLKNILVAALALAGVASAFSDEKVTATGHYYAPLSMPPLQARQEAINRAQIDAIRNAYGSSVSQTSLSITGTGEDGGRDSYYAIGECDVRGEWIETIGDTIWNIVPRERETLYEVTLKGRIREIPGGRADLDVRLLFNGTDKDRDQIRNSTYRVGDYMYIYFMSPIDGYLAVYLGDDDDALTMQCLVPYEGMTDGVFPVKGGQEYVLFSKDTAEDSLRPLTRRIKMNARNASDINQVYVIFSPNKFVKAPDTANMANTVTDPKTGKEISLLPRQADFTTFQKWLSRNRKRDRDLQIVKTLVNVTH